MILAIYFDGISFNGGIVHLLYISRDLMIYFTDYNIIICLELYCVTCLILFGLYLKSFLFIHPLAICWSILQCCNYSVNLNDLNSTFSENILMSMI